MYWDLCPESCPIVRCDIDVHDNLKAMGHLAAWWLRYAMMRPA